MYNIVLKDNEKIKLISDNSIIYNNDISSIYTSIITTDRYLILDYPSNTFNSKEDLRCSQRIAYIKQKEIIFETKLKDITKIKKYQYSYKIIFKNNNYILIDDKDVVNYLINNKNIKI